jgi:hypothetical protein
MTTLVLGVAGAAVGSMFGPLGASIGWSLGAALGSALDPPKIKGPRLNDLKLQTATYGAPIPIVYGSYRLAGTVIWQTDLVEHKSTSGGKGGPETTTYTYTASYAIMLCEGPIVGIGKIWADGRLIRDPDEPGPELPMTIYLGTETQTADPTMEADKGAGEVPAHRGTAYVVFTDHELGEFGNRIPNWEFEINAGDGAAVADCPMESIAQGDTSNEPTGGWAAQQDGGAGTPTDIAPYITAANGDAEPTVIAQAWEVFETTWSAGSFGYDHGSYIVYGGPLHLGHRVWVQTAHIIGSQTEFAIATGVKPVATMYNAGCGVPYDVIDYGQYSSTGGARHVYVSVGWTTAGGVCQPPPLEDANILAVDGITATHYVHATVGSNDGRRLFVMTADKEIGATGDIGMTNWWEINAGAVVRSGTIDPPLGQQVFGFGPSVQYFYDNLTCSEAENNGRYIWTVYGAGASPSNYVSCYWIDDAGNLAKICDSVGLTQQESNFPSPAIAAYDDGKCVVVSYTTWECFKRASFADAVDGLPHSILLSEIVSDISTRAGLTGGQIDVTELTDLVPGYCVTDQMSCRSALEPLLPVYFFDAVESDGKIKFPKRGRESIIEIPDDDLAAHMDGEDLPPIVSIARTQEDDLARSVSVLYINPDTDYQPGLQRAARQTGNASRDETLQLAIVVTDEYAKRVADALLFNGWMERDKYKFATSREYAHLDPTDVVTVRGRDMRITQRVETANGILAFDAVPESWGIWQQASVPGDGGGGFVPPDPPVLRSTDLMILNAPLYDDADAGWGFYPAMADRAFGSWPGATLYASRDGGTTYDALEASTTPSTFGAASTELGDYGGGNTFDELNYVTVVIGAGCPALASESELRVLNGANTAMLGEEMIQFKYATLTATNTYRLSGLLRGRRGTEWAQSEHLAGEGFVLLPTDLNIASGASEMGAELLYKPVTTGNSLAQTQAYAFANECVGQRVYAPVHLGGGRSAALDATLTWVRRARLYGAWVDGADVWQESTPEAYTIRIYASSAYGTIKREVVDTFFLSDAREIEYTAAQQTTDFGSTQATIYWGVVLQGNNGAGIEARGST